MKGIYNKIEVAEGRHCPLCGAPAELWEYVTDYNTVKSVMCSSGEECILSLTPDSFHKPTKREAIERWDNFVNSTQIVKLESQLTAEREARQKAEENAFSWKSQYYELYAKSEELVKGTIRQSTLICELTCRAEAAEQRIKASEDQEPAFVIHDELGNTHNLYKQPPELAEVVRERDELRRKLAEQQAVVQQAIALMEPIKNYLPASHIQRWIACIQSPSDHFTKLLEEAKRQPVPEGMITLPTTCPECGTKDIEYARMCHNSKCKGYAMEFSVYEGWRAAPQPERKD